MAVAEYAIQGNALTLPREIESIPATEDVAELQYSPRHGLLFLRSTGAIRVVDVATRTENSVLVAVDKFSSISLSPDGECLFASDFSATVPGGRVCRFDLSRREWEMRPGRFDRLKAVDAQRFIADGLYRFGTRPTMLSGDSMLMDAAYDAATRRVYQGNDPPSMNNQEVRAGGILNDSIFSYSEVKIPDTVVTGPLVLSTNGRLLYYGSAQFDAHVISAGYRVLPEKIHAATGDLAFGATAIYNSATAQPVGSLEFATSVYALATDGSELWAFEPYRNILHRYALTQEPATLSVQASAAGIDISGDVPGITPYPARCEAGRAVTIVAPPTAIVGGSRFSFDRWEIDGASQPAGITAVRVTMDAAHTANAIYSPQPAPFFPREIDAFAATGSGVQMEYSEAFGILLVRNSGTAIFAMNTQTRQPLDTRLAFTKFTDMSLSPDGRCLYAVDYASSGQTLVHRLDLATLSWQTAPVPAARRIEAVDSARFLLMHDSQYELALYRFGSTPEVLSSLRLSYYGDIEYDSASGRIYYATLGVSPSTITVLSLVGDNLSGLVSGKCTAMNNLALSTDGTRIYYARIQIATGNVAAPVQLFSETIYAATASLAFGRHGVYDALTGELLGDLGVSTSALALNSDGSELWVLDPVTQIAHHFALAPIECALTVRSTPALGAPIEGDKPGVATYTAACQPGESVALTSAPAFVADGTRYRFIRWTLDGASQPAGQAQLQLVVQSHRVAEAVYQQDALVTPLPVEIESFPYAADCLQLAYSPSNGLLFLRETKTLHVIDAVSHAQISRDTTFGAFSDMSLSNDESSLFYVICDADGSGSEVGHYKIPTRTWTTYSSWRPYYIEAISGTDYAVTGTQDVKPVRVSHLNQLIAQSVSLVRNYSDIECDPATRLIFVGTPPNNGQIRTMHLVGNSIGESVRTESYGPARDGRPPVVLATDARRLYYGAVVLETLDVRNDLMLFREQVYAATPDLVFCENAFYHARSGAKLGSIGFPCTIYAFTNDASEFWAFNSADKTLHHYRLTDSTVSLAVRSEPVTGLSITGDRPGVTGYFAVCVQGQPVNLTAPSTIVSAGARYDFQHWRVNGIDYPDGVTSLQIVPDADTTAVAVYGVRTFTLTVSSTPVQGIAIDGTIPGTTSYSADCLEDLAVSLSAPPVAVVGDVRYSFVQWKLDGIGRPAGQALLTVSMNEAHAAVAAYQVQTHGLTVQSTPVTGVPITGTSAGSTNYTASCEDQLVVSLWAPKLVVVQNARYKLLRWTLDGADQPPGQASLQLVMDAPHTAVAVYEQVAPSLILRGPADRGEPPLPPAGSTFTVDVYLNNLYGFAGMQAALGFIDASGSDAGFLISTAGGNSTFDGMKIDFNSSLWPVIFAVTAGDLRTFGFMSMAGDTDITQETWVFTITYEYGPSAPGGYSIVTDPLLTAVGGGSGGINFQESAGSLVIQQQALRGDIDGNCVVDLADLIAVRDRLLVDPGSPGYLDADLNGDGRVNVLDLILVRNLMGRKCEENEE